MARKTMAGPAYPVFLADISNTDDPSVNDGIGSVGIKELYSVVGNHSSGATISSAIKLVKPSGATAIIIQAITQNVRFTLDGTMPSATVGFQLQTGLVPVIIHVHGSGIWVIQEAATASLQYQWISE